MLPGIKDTAVRASVRFVRRYLPRLLVLTSLLVFLYKESFHFK